MYPVKVSVVVPAYNREDYLEECINSIESQVGPSFEIIIVDDCSTDGTYELALELCAKSPRKERDFHVFRHKENLGTCQALHTGFIHARGEYIAVVDSDDLLAPFGLKILADRLNRNKNVDYVWSLYEAFDGDYDNLRIGTRCRWPAPRNQKEVIIQNLIRFSTFHLKMMRAEAYKTKMVSWLEMPDSSVDYAFVLDNMFRVNMQRVPHVAYYYRNKTPGSHSAKKVAQKECAEKWRKKALEFAYKEGFLNKEEITQIQKRSRELGAQKIKNNVKDK